MTWRWHESRARAPTSAAAASTERMAPPSRSSHGIRSMSSQSGHDASCGNEPPGRPPLESISTPDPASSPGRYASRSKVVAAPRGDVSVM